MPDLDTIVKDIAEAMRARPDRGAVARYIPELARIDPQGFGLVVIDGEGRVAAGGDGATGVAGGQDRSARG